MRKFYSLLLVMLFGMSAMAATFSTFNSRTDFRDESIYFVMTTRFYDGDPSNNVHCWDANKAGNAGDPEWRGDFKGLIEKLDYIKALGFTAIWITPVVQNASGYDYHGYHASDFSKVDFRYESQDCKFQDLITAAHARGMKVILDIVLNHTGNFGEENLCKEFTRDTALSKQADIDACMIPNLQKNGGNLPNNYLSMPGGQQYDTRLALMKNTDGQNHDTHNYWHHFGNFNWDNSTRWWAQIAGDCVDLNTENPAVYNYLVRCYSAFIAMGVDGFRIDTSGHIARLTFNKAFIPAFTAAGAQHAAARGTAGTPFYMFGEVCARANDVTYRNLMNMSPYYYTWKESTNYAWDESEASWISTSANEHQNCDVHTNHVSCQQQDAADGHDVNSSTPTSQNAFLNGNNDYHTPDYSRHSNFNVIDFTTHWNFCTASGAWGTMSEGNDKYYNDASWNVVYVDSHDYAPDCCQSTRFTGSQDTWAENLSLMFTFRGIPCIYYGSEIEFMKGAPIDVGPNAPLKTTGRAYMGGYLKGDINATNFGVYTATGNVAQTLSHPLAQHIRRLNMIRQAVPALRKGQYKRESNGFAFRRRYTDATTDSYVLVTISNSHTFSNVPNGTYVDCVSGDTQTVTNGSLQATCSGQGNLRVYVLSTALTPAPGKIGDDNYYSYGSTRGSKTTPAWDGTQTEDVAHDPGMPGGYTPEPEPTDTITPCLGTAEQLCAFFNSEGTSIKSNVTAHLWGGAKGTTWPGVQAQNLGAGMWKVIVPAECGTPTKIIWSSGGQNQTADLDYDNHAIYNGATITGHITLLCDSDDTPDPTPGPGPGPTPGPDTDPIEGACRIYYAGDYATPYIWAWETGGVNYTGGNWPGQPMVQASETFEGQPLWYYEFQDVLPTNVIFSNHGNPQTADLTTVGCDYVYTGSTWKPLHAEEPTAVPNTIEQTCRAWADGNTLHVVTPTTQNVCIYSATGQLLRVFPMTVGECTVSNVPAGIYMVGGQKVVVK